MSDWDKIHRQERASKPKNVYTDWKSRSKKRRLFKSKMRAAQFRKATVGKSQSKVSRPLPDRIVTQKRLIVTTPHYVACCVWTKIAKLGWHVSHCTEDLSWMRGMDPEECLKTLRTIGATWQWLPIGAPYNLSSVNRGVIRQPDRARTTNVSPSGETGDHLQGHGQSQTEKNMLPTD
jgi:hypothetical protein